MGSNAQSLFFLRSFPCMTVVCWIFLTTRTNWANWRESWNSELSRPGTGRGRLKSTVSSSTPKSYRPKSYQRSVQNGKKMDSPCGPPTNISSAKRVCQTRVLDKQSVKEEPQELPNWCISKCSCNSRSFAIATRFTTVIQERQKYPRFGADSLALSSRIMACIVLRRGTSLKLSSCSRGALVV